MKINLEDTTFLIPIRPDTIIRIENLLAVICFFKKNFNTKIMVLESAEYNNKIVQRLLPKDVEYYFVEDEDPIFYRTKYLNFLTQKVQTSFIGIWDADVVIPPMQILDSLQHLRSYDFEIAYPYDGTFLDTSEIIRLLFLQYKKIKVLVRNSEKMRLIYGNNMRGGAILVNTQKYIHSGMENEQFYGWGPEDHERFCRWENLNYRIYTCPGSLFHLTHPRDINGKFNSVYQMEFSRNELHNTITSSPEKIIMKKNINND